jgi:hypothetical protein
MRPHHAVPKLRLRTASRCGCIAYPLAASGQGSIQTHITYAMQHKFRRVRWNEVRNGKVDKRSVTGDVKILHSQAHCQTLQEIPTVQVRISESTRRWAIIEMNVGSHMLSILTYSFASIC